MREQDARRSAILNKLGDSVVLTRLIELVMIFQQHLKRVVLSPWFDGVMGFAVLVNAAFMVAECEIENQTLPWWWEIVDHFFLGIFTLELFMRLGVIGWSFAKTWGGGTDFFICFTGWVYLWLMPLVTRDMELDELKTLQSLKILRVFRCVRMLRMLAMFKDLWLIVSSFFECLTALAWTVVFILIILFIFGMFGLELIGRSGDFEGTEAQQRFERPVSSMLVLFQIMSLDGWMEIISPCFKKQAWTYVFFIFFIGIGALALLNLVTAVVVESSVKKVRENQEYQREHFTKDVAKRSKEIRDFWMDLQGGKSRRLNVEIEKVSLSKVEFLDKAMPHRFLTKQMKKLGMHSVADYLYLFHILDEDGNGSLELREVICGVLKLQQLVQDKDAVGTILAAGTEVERRLMLSKAMSVIGNDIPTQLNVIERLIEKIVHRLEVNLEILATARRSKILNTEAGSAPGLNTACHPDTDTPTAGKDSSTSLSHEVVGQDSSKGEPKDTMPASAEHASLEARQSGSATPVKPLLMKSSTWSKCLEAQKAAQIQEEQHFRSLVAQRRADIKSQMKFELDALRKRLANSCCKCCGSKTTKTEGECKEIERLEERLLILDNQAEQFEHLEQRISGGQPGFGAHNRRAPAPLGSLCAWKPDEAGSKKETLPSIGTYQQV